ncbi:hypothetical protein FB45DRAFT_539614 [Roridomyces roridus]|uniref:C3H1-type domain-containing protein n=1 Tax=Roridomyces roridus TaxID=1738132 RepID=A0AAD7BUU7_9AGAR|nr:hypothetical protein FB45DRAFT_539614 [Roridomyces roridus]
MPAALTTSTSPVTLTNGQADAWPQTHDHDGETPLENWHLNDSPSNFQPIRRPPPGLQKLSFPSTMSSLTDSPSANPDVAAGTSRWRFNTNGQLVDSESESAEWDLADEIVRLKIGEVSGDANDDIPIRTPPKSKLASAQLAETSPLDTASNPSVNSSPLASDHIGASHSRGSSTDTTLSSSRDSVASNTMVAPGPVTDAKERTQERPHSFSGGLSSADLRRLQQVGDANGTDAQETPFQQQWASIQFGDKQFAPEQPAYPSLANQGAPIHRPQPQLYDYRTGAPQNAPNRDDLQIDYNIQQRNFNPLPQGANVAAPPFIPGRPNNVPGMPYRQPPPRGFPQQGLLPSPTALGYPGAHAPHLSLGNSQQLYEMMLPGHENHHPAVSRVQQQHNAFRGAHHHSTSDPSALRDAATLALLNSNMQAFAGNMFPQGMAPPPAAMPMYANQFYAPQEAYGRPDVATAQAMAARLQAQYTGPYGAVMAPPSMGMTDGSLSPSSTNGQGPSANNRKLGLYKTELCRSWEEKGTCRYAGKCQFAHGEDELRNVSRHPKYKTEICRTFWVSGSCPYGKRCCFIHTELPPSGAAGEAVPPPPRSDGRERSLSTNSDPNEGSVSLLARIAKREPSNMGTPTPTEATPTTPFQFTRPPTGSLRVDTSVEGSSLKQNKSAYPSFASNGMLIHPPDRLAAKSPAPVTAGPDLGRHNNAARLEIVGYSQRNSKASTPSNSRHSLNGSEGEAFSPTPPPAGHSPFTLPAGDSTSNAGRTNGHVRAGSAGNWGSFSRSSHLTSAYGQSSPSTETAVNSPWSTTELAVGSSRLHEKAWA